MLDLLRAMGRPLASTPFHPQWLLRAGRASASDVRKVAAGRVLDIGCANRWVENCLPRGCEYIGLDYPPTGKLMYRARPNVFADAARLPFADGSIDTVVMLDVLEHLRRPREALQEIARVLRPNGRLLLTVPLLYPVHDAPHDYQRYTMHGLLREIESVGLRAEELHPSLGSAETAGLVACLAAGGMAVESTKSIRPGTLLVPVLVLSIPLINVIAWLLGRLVPSWPALTAGYRVAASKP